MIEKLSLGITGANSNLGRLIAHRINAENFDLSLFSSSPNSNQFQFDLDGEVDLHRLSECNIIVHCARPYPSDTVKTQKELEILDYLCERRIRIVNISSVSGFLDEKNAYGAHKRAIYDWAEKNAQTNLLSGLIFGHDFKGQIFKLSRALRLTLVKPVFVGEFETYLTPVELILDSLRAIIMNEDYRSQALICKNPMSTNRFLENIAGNTSIELRMDPRKISKLLKFLPSTSYFNEDSFLGLVGRYKEIKQTEMNFTKDWIIDRAWIDYCNSNSTPSAR